MKIVIYIFKHIQLKAMENKGNLCPLYLHGKYMFVYLNFVGLQIIVFMTNELINYLVSIVLFLKCQTLVRSAHYNLNLTTQDI